MTLPAEGSATPVAATAASGEAAYGPATIFSSGRLDVSTEGMPGATGSVTSSANVQNVNASGSEVFTATAVSSTCTASEAGTSGSTTITGGTLQVDNGSTDHPAVVVTLPANPAPNTVLEGHVHLSETDTDNFRYVFNEQVVNDDGSITVNAAHQYLLGPFAVGDLIIGQSVCGVTAGDPTTTTTDHEPGGGTQPSGYWLSAADGGSSPSMPPSSARRATSSSTARSSTSSPPPVARGTT